MITNDFKMLLLFKAIVEAQIQAMGMQAENEQRKVLGYSMAYGEKEFQEVLDDLNAVWEANRP